MWKVIKDNKVRLVWACENCLDEGTEAEKDLTAYTHPEETANSIGEEMDIDGGVPCCSYCDERMLFQHTEIKVKVKLKNK